MHSVWLLIAFLVALRFVPGRREPEAEWSLPAEVALAVGIGLGFALVGTFWFSPLHLSGSAMTSDLFDFCGATAAMRDHQMADFGRDRSRLAAWLPALLVEGRAIMDGLALSAIVSLGVLGSAVYAWARILHSRFAGWAAILTALAVCTGCAALGCLAVRTRSVGAFLAAGIGCALALLIDVRGLVWAAPVLVLCAGVAALTRERRVRLFVALLVPIGLSWLGGHQVYTHKTTSLDAQAHPIRLYLEYGVLSPDGPRPVEPSDMSRFIWGHSPLVEIPKTLWGLVDDTRTVAPLLRNIERNQTNRQRHLDPWGPVGLMSLVMVGWGLRRHRDRLGALLITSLPFFAVLFHTANLEFRFRFAASGLPVLPVFLGLGLALWWRIPVETADDSGERRWSGRSFALLAMLGTLVVGPIPNFLAPESDWRTLFHPDRDRESLSVAALLGTAPPIPNAQPCVDAMIRDIQAGHDPMGAWFRESSPEPRARQRTPPNRDINSRCPSPGVRDRHRQSRPHRRLRALGGHRFNRNTADTGIDTADTGVLPPVLSFPELPAPPLYTEGH